MIAYLVWAKIRVHWAWSGTAGDRKPTKLATKLVCGFAAVR